MSGEKFTSLLTQWMSQLDFKCLYLRVCVMYLPQWPWRGPVCVLSTDNRTVCRTVRGCTDHCDPKLWHIRLWAKKLLPVLRRSPHFINSASVLREWPRRVSQLCYCCQFRGLFTLSLDKNSSDTRSCFLVVLIEQQHLLLLRSFVWSAHSFKANGPNWLHTNLCN